MFFGGDFFRFFDCFGLAVQVADTSTNSGEPWHLESKVFGLLGHAQMKTELPSEHFGENRSLAAGFGTIIWEI